MLTDADVEAAARALCRYYHMPEDDWECMVGPARAALTGAAAYREGAIKVPLAPSDG